MTTPTLVGQFLLLVRPINVVVLEQNDYNTHVASIPEGETVEVKSTYALDPPVLVGHWQGKRVLISELDLPGATELSRRGTPLNGNEF